jgi:UDP:flavonoid glycosyltransferase YjiC (YdhE family)
VETQIRTGGTRSINAAAALEITRSIEDVLGDVTYRDRARAIAAEMTATPTAEEVLTRLPSRGR